MKGLGEIEPDVLQLLAIDMEGGPLSQVYDAKNAGAALAGERFGAEIRA